MINIGTKIKSLRKERRMTLAQVAGDRLTKGMLSLIENGKAQPSMESLQHIAKQLDLDISDLMQSEDNEKIHTLYLQVEPLVERFNKELNKVMYKEKGQEIIKLIEPCIDNRLLKGNNYEAVRLYEIYLTVRFLLKIDTSITLFFEVVTMYEQIHAYSKILKVFSRISAIQFEQRLYEDALETLLNGEKYIERYGNLMDEIKKIDLYYNITIIYAALNNEQKTEHYLDMTLKIAKEKKILYRLNDFYRFLFLLHCSQEDAEKSRYYLRKIKAFTEIIEDPTETFVEQLLGLIYTNQIEQDYEKTITLTIDTTPLQGELLSDATVYMNGEYAYAYWHLGQYKAAQNLLTRVFVPEHNQHPLDLVRVYRSFAIRALCYEAEDHIEQAKREILYAMDGVKTFKDTPDKLFIVRAYNKIIPF